MTALHQRTAHTGDALRYSRAAAFAAVCVVLAGGGHVLASSADPSAHAALPAWWTWPTGFLLVLGAALPLAGRSRSLPGIAGLLIACQLALHTLFVLGQQAVATAAAHRPGAGQGLSAAAEGLSDAAVTEQAARFVCGAHLLTAEQARRILVDAGLGTDLAALDRTSAATSGGGVHTHAALGSDALVPVLPSLPMLLGHVLAGLAAGWLLRRGDLALLRLLRLAERDPADAPAVLRPLHGAFALTRVLCAGLTGAPGRPPVPPGTAFDALPAPPTAPLLHTVIRRGPPVGAPALALAA